MFLIIDGYNLIFSGLFHAEKHLRQQFIRNIRDNEDPNNNADYTSPGFLGKARDNLIAQLKLYNTKRRLKIIVIFDGDESIGYQSHQKESPDIEIIFSTKKSKADNLIIDIVSYYKEDRFHNKSNQTIRVVTSDRALTQTLRKSGVQIISANDFIRELFKTNQFRHHSISDGKKADMVLENEPIEKFIGLPQSEVEKWLKIFTGKSNE
jgi:predicted RNA-binding protein with PIN domain